MSTGVDYSVKTLTLDNMKVAMQLWDTAGQERWVHKYVWCDVLYCRSITVYVVVESIPWSSPGGRQRTLGQTLNIFEHVLKNVLKKSVQ